MQGVEIHPAVNAEAARLSPARRESFIEGAAYVTKLLAERSFEEAVGAQIRVLVGDLNRSATQAGQMLKRFDGLVAPEADLDERGVRAVSLTGILLKQYRDALLPPADGHRSGVEWAGVAREISRSVSYSVWAYLSSDEWPGEAVPA